MQRFTEAELEEARNVDLPSLLTSLGYHVKRVGNCYTTQEMDSLRIWNRRHWYRYSEGVGGDSITFLQHFCGKSFPEAVRELIGEKSRSMALPRAPPMTKETKQPFVLPPAHSDQRRVFAYLRKRGIAAQVINGFIQAGLLYEDAKYHNCVFVGRNADGKPVFASKRGTYDQDGRSFKGDAAGSDKSVAFRLYPDPEKDTVYVFEAPIDLMSFCTLHREVTRNAVALCGLYDAPLETYLRENPHLKRIALCLDADPPGREAATRLAGKYGCRGYTMERHQPPAGKDWNEWLQQKQKVHSRMEVKS